MGDHLRVRLGSWDFVVSPVRRQLSLRAAALHACMQLKDFLGFICLLIALKDRHSAVTLVLQLVQCVYGQAGREACLRRAKLPGSSRASSYKTLRGCSRAGVWAGRETCQPLWTHRLAPR
jgi:hypothetical protein